MIAKISKCCLLGLLLLTPLCQVFSQTIWLNQKQNFALEVLKPNLDGKDNTTFISSAIYLTVRFPVSQTWHLVGELPFAHGELDFPGQRGHDEFGNPYLGLEIRNPDAPLFTELGVRLPLANSSFASDFIGFFADVDRLEAFAVDNYAFLAAVNFQPVDYYSFKYRIRAGSSLLMQTEGDTDPDVFLFISGQLGFESDRLELLGGVSARSRLTEDGQLSQRTFLQLGVGANYRLGHFRPGLHFRLPLEPDLLEIIDWVFGLNLGFTL